MQRRSLIMSQLTWSQSFHSEITTVSAPFNITSLETTTEDNCPTTEQKTTTSAYSIFNPQTKNIKRGYFEGYLSYKGEPEGKGKKVLENGDVYDGDFSSGLPWGRGEIYFTNKSHYKGDFVRGHPHGRGKYTYANGNIYSGNFVNGKFDGNGKVTIHYLNGSSYEGWYHNGMCHGEGKLTFKNGDYLIGNFHEGVVFGTCKYYSKLVDKTFEDDFTNINVFSNNYIYVP